MATEIHGASFQRKRNSQLQVKNNRVWLPKLPPQPNVKQDGWTSSLVLSCKVVPYSMSVSVLPSIEKVNCLII